MRAIVVATLGVRSDGRGPSSVHCILPRRRDSRPDFRTGVTLLVANSLRSGSRSGLVTVAGAGAGKAISLTATTIGLVAFFALLSEIFQFVRWAGALYLIWPRVKSWQVRGVRKFASITAARRSWHSVFLQGFLIAITNPKAIVFYSAFLP